jgi:hypothetical protein
VTAMTQGEGRTRDGRVVPVYVFTRGRTRSAGPDLPIEAVVTMTENARKHTPALEVESAAIIRLCARPMSVAEIGAALGVPVGVARVLVGDLIDRGSLTVHLPRPADRGEGPGREILGRLLEGLRAR